MMADGSIRIVIPMKPLARCKLRLAPILDEPLRARLALWMLERVATAAAGVSMAAEVSIVGGDEAIRALCLRLGVRWHPDPAGDLNQALQSAYAATSQLGMDGMLFLAGDLPAVRTSDLDGIVAAFAGTDLVLAPGARGGTNAILVRRDLPFAFLLGGQSLHRHRELAESLGLAWKPYERPALHADVDVPSDLAWLEQEEPELWQRLALLDAPSPVSSTQQTGESSLGATGVGL